MTGYPGDFEAQARELLLNVYDYLSLAQNPIAQRLGRDLAGAERAQAVRRMVFAAIDEMKSESGAQTHSRQNRLYHILLLRYVEQQATSETLNQLALSERQYYREHQRAIQTISQIIWDKYFAARPAESGSSLIAELDHLQRLARPERFDPRAEIEAALAATRALAQERGIELAFRGDEAPPKLKLAGPVFRQFVILLLSKLIPLTSRGGRIAIEWRTDSAPELAFFVSGVDDAWRESMAALTDDKSFAELSKRLNATLKAGSAESGGARLTLKFDQASDAILVIDDNPDAIRLFERYVANEPYQLLAARDESEALRLAQSLPLMCIILDIMLPRKDGWQILQLFKSHPATAEIPVLICSALDMRALALSLGADGYIQKPPSRDEFLSLLRQWAG